MHSYLATLTQVGDPSQRYIQARIVEVLQPRSLWAALVHDERVGETWVAPPCVMEER